MRFYAIEDTYAKGRRLDLSPLGFAGQRVSMFLQQICYLHENAEERYPVGFDFLFDSDRELSLLPRGDEEELVDGVTPLEWEVDLFLRQLSEAVATHGWKLSRFGTQKQFLDFLESLMADYREAHGLFDWRRSLLGRHFDGAVGAVYRGASRVVASEREKLDTVILTRVAKVRDVLYFDWTKENLDRYFELCEELNNGGLAYLRFHDSAPPVSDEELLELRTELEVHLLWDESTA